MTLNLPDCQKERIGRLIWSNIDGVAKNVMPLISAINTDVASGVKVVARDEWERCQARIGALYSLLASLEARTIECSHDQVVSMLQAILRRDPATVAQGSSAAGDR